MTTTANKELSPYQVRMNAWDIQQDKDCANYQKAKVWAIANGYKLHKDVSYNGFIYIQKEFCLTEDPHDGHCLELQIHANTTDDRDKYHSYQQEDMEAEFGNIMDETKYRFKYSHEAGAHASSKDVETILAKTLEREKQLVAEFEQYLKENPTTEWKMTDPDNFQYGRLYRGIPEFKEFDRITFDKLYDKMKLATEEKLDAYLKSEFENELLWIKKSIFLSRYTEQQKEVFISGYYKDLNEVRKIYGTDSDFIIAECIFEQTSGLY